MALVNLLRNGTFYGPYLLACAAMGAMLYILRYLGGCEAVASVKGAAYLQAMMGIGTFVVTAFAAVVLLYANSFVMKRRHKELGLYHILGLEKRHTACLLFWETFACAALSIAGGILAGVLLSHLLLTVLMGMIQLPLEGGALPWDSAAALETGAWMGALFALTLAFNLVRLGRSRPVELLRSREAGEREPRTKGLLAVIGCAALGGGYGLAITIQDPVEAMAWFFAAVALVMLGTYCLFTAGSVAVLKALRRSRRFYYRTRPFTAVSGLLYRMKGNAVGLANICILSSMVLVTVSTTACLYLGLDQMLSRQLEKTTDAAWQAALRQDYAAMYGGFLFLGLFLGVLFLLTTALIIYYKQLSEGFEDRRRFTILQQVGMSREEARGAIHVQILLVFFLPLGTAALHTLAAGPMLCRMLELFGLRDGPLFAVCEAAVLLAFCGVYGVVYALTSRTYERIVGVRETRP